jgi:hypothetical protein
MMRTFIWIILIICSASVWSQTVTTMHPFSNCPELEVKYEKIIDQNQEFFKVSFTDANNEVKIFKVENIKSIIEKSHYVPTAKNAEVGLHKQLQKELSLIEHLKKRAAELCPLKREESGVFCETRSYPITQEFETFISQITEKLAQNDEDICSEIPNYALLKAEVEGLDNQKIFQYKKSRHWAKIFKNVGNKKSIKEKYINIFKDHWGVRWKTEWKEFWPNFEKNSLQNEMENNRNYTSSLIDAWVACGGRKNDGLFLKNLIKMSAVESCLAPKPPGSISSEELEELSAEIAKKNKKKTLLGTYLKRETIMLDAIKELTEKAVKNSIMDNFGEIIDPNPSTRNSKIDEFVNNLEVMKKLKGVQPKTEMASVFPEYTSYVFAPNAKMEIAEKMIPYVIENFLSNYIINTNKQEVINNFRNKTIENFKDCKTMNSNFSLIYDDEKYQLSHRMLYHRDFCSKLENADKCNSPCKGPSYLEKSELKSDEDVIKECLVYALAVSTSGVTFKLEFKSIDIELKL